MANMYIICGCNGAGKTTASYTMLPDMLGCDEYIDADEIAKGLSPDDPSQAAIRASRLMVERFNELIEKGKDFGLETTLSTRSLVRMALKAKRQGFSVHIIYFWLKNPELAIERVKRRYEAGGHIVPEETIRRRYSVGIDNLIKMYMPICDSWAIYDNSLSELKLVARGGFDRETEIANPKTYAKILDYYKST